MTTGNTISQLTSRFGQKVVVEKSARHETVIVPRDILRDVLIYLKNNKETQFVMLTDLFAVDYLAQEPRFEVVYFLNSFKYQQRVSVKVRVADGESVPTVSDIWQGANWLEREAFDMFGIHFDNHPDLRRILMVEDFAHYPLRKDFPTEGHGFDNPFSIYLEDAQHPDKPKKAGD